MKIAIFNWRDATHPQAGGAESYIVEIAKEWAKHGHAVTFFCSSYPNAIEEETVDGIHYIRKGGKFSVYFYAANHYNHRDYDIIIDCNNGIPFFTPLFTRQKKILLIFHISGDMWYKETNRLAACIGKFLETKMMPWLYKCKVVTISPSSKQQCKEIGLPEAEIVYPGIDPWYSPGIKAPTPEIIYVGRLKKYKSVDTLLRAVELVNRNMIVHIAGTGDDEQRLKRIAEELRLSGVVFYGYVSEITKVRSLQRSWIFVNPSSTEGWAISNMEAAASGVPVIASAVNGNKDSVKHNETGLLFPHNDVGDLAMKIEYLLKHPGIRFVLSDNAVKWAKNFSWEKSAAKFEDILKREVYL
jgi:glycosyltransferase involved in cell wall biosynthesis